MPRLPQNVEKSAFRPGTYVIYDGAGHVWHCSATGGNARPGAASNPRRAYWRAVPGPSHPSRWLSPIEGSTLTNVADALAARGRPLPGRVNPQT